MKTAKAKIVKIKIRKNDFDEFEVQWLENGVKNEAKITQRSQFFLNWKMVFWWFF